MVLKHDLSNMGELLASPLPAARGLHPHARRHCPCLAHMARTFQGRAHQTRCGRLQLLLRGGHRKRGLIGRRGLRADGQNPRPHNGFRVVQEQGRYSWQKQECYKGRHTSFWDFKFAASDTMGWGVEAGASPPASTEAYRTAPYFHRNPSLILQNDASAILAQRDPLLEVVIEITQICKNVMSIKKKSHGLVDNGAKKNN